MGFGGSRTVHIEAAPELLYGMVSDVTRMGDWSRETYEVEWIDGATGAAVGARFRGRDEQTFERPSSRSARRSPARCGRPRTPPWPAPGRWVHSGQTLGWIDIRVAAQERLTLQDNLNNARLKKEGAEKVVALQRERVNRVESVSRSQIVPGQQLDDAKVLLAEAETQLAIATAAVELWRKALEEVDRPGHRETTTYSQPLVSPGDGEVTELAARPGMSIEAGGLVAQLVDFRRVLVRLDIPPELLAAGPPGPLRLQAIAASPAALSGDRARDGDPEPPPPIEAIPVGPAPRVDAASQFIGYWYESEPDRPEGAAGKAVSVSGRGRRPGTIWRPGLLVKASMTPPGARSQTGRGGPRRGRPLPSGAGPGVCPGQAGRLRAPRGAAAGPRGRFLGPRRAPDLGPLGPGARRGRRPARGPGAPLRGVPQRRGRRLKANRMVMARWTRFPG